MREVFFVVKDMFETSFIPAILFSLFMGVLCFFGMYITLKREQKKKEKRDFIMRFLR